MPAGQLENLLTAGPAGHLIQKMNTVYMGRGSNFGTPKKINKMGLYHRKIWEIWENTLYMEELSHYLVTNVGKTMLYIYNIVMTGGWCRWHCFTHITQNDPSPTEILTSQLGP